MKPRSPFQLVRKGSRNLAIAIFSLIAANAASATSATWTGTTDAIWTTLTNWNANPVPGTSDTATFNNAGGALDTISLGATNAATIGNIIFDTATCAAYTIGSGAVGTQTLTLDNGGAIAVNSTVTQQQIFNTNIVLGNDGTASDFTITNNRAGFSAVPYLQFNGTFTGSTGSGLKTLTFDANGTFATNSFSALGNISDGTSGSVKLVKKGAGIMTLGVSTTTMSYTGGTYLDAGTLQIVGVAGNLQAGTSLYIAGGTNLNCINQTGGSYSNIAQQWNGDFSFNDANKYSGASLQPMTFTGTVNLGASGTDTVRTVNALANTLTLNSIISDGTNGTTTGLTKAGAGTMVLGGINTYTGATTVNAGTLTITNTSTGSGAFAVNGGALTLSGTLGSIINSSAITLAGGNLQLRNTSTAEGSVNRLGNSTAITSNGGTLTYNNDNLNTYAENVGYVTLNGGQLNTVLSTNMTSGSQTLTLNSLTQNNRSTATFSAATTTPNATANLIKVAGATATATGGIIGAWATTGTSAKVQTDYAVYDASGNIVAANIAGSADSTWTDSTKAYTSNFLGGVAANGLSAITHNMAALRNAPAFGNAATATTIVIPSGGNLNTYGLLNASTALWTINPVTGSTGALSTPSGGGNLYINTGNGTATGNGAITIGAPINDNGAAVSIVKTGQGFSNAVGQGVLTLSNVTSNYSGATVINGGAIVLNTTGALANINTASSLGKGSSGGSAADLVLNGGFLQYSGAGATSTNRLFSVGAMGGTIDSSSATAASTMSFIGTGAMGFVDTGARTLTLQGSNIGVAASTSGSNTSQSTLALLIGDNSGATSLTKTGTGTWALTNAASTYTGPTTITGGILNVGTFAAVNTASSLGMGSATSSAADIILNAGTLQYSNNTAATTNRLFSVGTTAGSAIDSSAASPSNTLSFTATGAMGFNNTVGVRTLTLQGTNTGANSLGLLLGDYGGATALTKSNNGTWALGNAANTYTGITTINGGILSVGKLANGGVASSIGASTNAATNLVFNSTNSGAQTTIAGLVNAIIPNTGSNAPILKYTGSGDSTDRLINFTNSAASRFAVIDASGGAALNFTNTGSPTFITTNQKFTLVLAGSNTNDNTFAGVIPNNGTFGVSVVKIGTGTWILSGNNTYSDAAGTAGDFGTLVNQGTLVLSGSPTAATALKTTVNAGGTLKLDYSTNNTSKLSDNATLGILTLAGGTLNLSGGSHVEVVGLTTISPGASSVIQTNSGTSILRMNAITRNAGGMVDFGVASIASTTTANTAAGILGAYATIGGADWAIKSVTVENGSNNLITALGTYADIDALGSTIVSASATNVRLNSAGTGSNIAMAAGTTTINTLLQGTTAAATVDTSSAKILQTTGIMIGTGMEALTIGVAVGDGQLQAATSAGDLVLSNFNSSKILTINAPITANGASTLTTSGNVTLNGVNTYTGATFVNSGTLTISGTGSLNSGSYAGVITLAQGATLNYTSSSNQTLGTATAGFGNFIWNPSSSSAVLTLSVTRGATPSILTVKSGIATYPLNSSISFLGTGPASDLVLDGGIIMTRDSGGGDSTSRLFTLGTGGGTIQVDTLAIPGSATRTTSWTNTGAIAFTGSGTRTLKFESAIANVNFFSPAVGDGTGGATSVVMGGTVGANGVWALSGANTYTGTTTVNGGSLSIRKTQSVNNGVAYFTPANINIVSGGGIAIGVGAGPTYFDSAAIATILDSSHLGASTTTTGLKVGAQFGLDTTAGDFTYSGILTDLPAGTNNVFNLAKHGLGILTLSGNNTYTGTTTIYGNSSDGATGQGTSILRAGSATAFGQAATASIVFDQGSFATINKLQLFGNNVAIIGLNSPVSVHRDGKGENYIESGSSDTSGTGTDIFTINTPNATTNTWNNGAAANAGKSIIQDGGARRLGITKGDAGTLELGGTNTYTGGTIINAGILRALSTTAFGAAASATLSFGSSSTGTVQLNGNSMTLVGLNTNATVGTPVVEAGATNATLTINPSVASPSTFAGVLRNNSGSGGTLSLTVGGPGTLTLSGDNTYTGNTSVTGGKLIFSGSNASAITGTTTGSGGVIQYNSLAAINGTALNNVTVTAPGAMAFGASLSDADIVTGLGRVANGSTGAIAADNNTAGAFDFTNLTAASLGAVGSVNYSGSLTPNGTTYRLGGGGGTLTYGLAISGSALAITGASTGSVVLSNNSNTLGALTVSSGILDLNATTGQTAAAVTLAGGTVQNGTLTGTSYSGTGGTSTAVLAGNSIAFTQTSGTTTLNATNTYGGGTTLSGGTLKAVAAGSLGTNTVTLNGGNLSLASDGTGTGLGNSKLESISYGNAVAVSANQSITVGQFTVAVGTLNAANKTLQLGTLGIGANTLTVTNNNGFGLEFTGTTTLSGIPTFSVSGGTNAPIVPGLTLSGQVTGLFGINKNGAGTLVLGSGSNDFGIVAGGSLIDVTNGLVSISSDAQLGQALNQVSLHLLGSGLQLNPDGTGSFAHRINTTTAAGVIDVTQFGTTNPTTTNVATLTTAFNGGAASANAFSKTGNGILEINVANNGATPYTGVITISAGAIRVSNAGALGAAANNTVVTNSVGAAVQLNALTLDTLNIAEPFNISNSGINTGGALQAIGGTLANPRSISTSGVITLANAATIGADAYTTLNIGTNSMVGAQALTLAGAGTININTALPAFGSITKIGGGVFDLSAASTSFVGALTVNAGTFKIDGTTAKIGGTGAVSVANGATLTLDNTAGSVASRLGGRPITLAGAMFNFTGNGATAETLGALTAINAGLTTINTNTSGTLKFASQTARSAGGVVNVVSGGTSTVQFATAPALTPASTGILPGWFVGNEFATHGGNNTAIAAFAAGSYTTGDLGTVVAATGTFKPSGTQTAINTKTINALNLTGTIGATIGAGQTLTLTSVGLINSGTGNITGGYLSPTVELIANYADSSSISSIITGSPAFTKTGTGNLTLSALDNYTGQTTVNQGALTLGGGNNTLAVNKAMVVNNGGTLALGSNNQYVGSLLSTGSVEDSGGTITGTGVTLTTNATNGTFAGNISGSINLVKAGANTMILSSAQSTTGTIAVIGGGLTLKDGGTLLGTTGGITINGATLTIDNTGTKDLADRVNGSAIILNSGTITYNGRAQFNSTESLGAVTANSGLSTINVVAGGTGVNSAQLTLASLTRSTGAALVFNTNAATLGQIGSNPRLVVNGGLTGNLVPVNGVVPGVFDFIGANHPRVVGYIPGLGFGEIGTPGFAKFVKLFGLGANYTLAQVNDGTYVPQVTDNVMLVGNTGATWNLTSTTTINSIITSAENASDQVGAITFSSPTNILKLQSGNFTMGASSSNPVIGTVASRGVLTSGQSELFILATKIGATYLTFHSVIADNGANPVSAVFSGTAAAATTVLTAPNTYTGGTYVNGGTLNLTATDPGAVVIPYSSANSDAGVHGLVITNATVTQSSAAAQQIDPRNTVTLNGSSVLTLTGNNTLANIVFNSNGGTGSPGVASGNILTLTGHITSTPTNVGLTAVPTISGTLDLNNTSHNITVDGGATAASLFHAGNGAAVTGLTISSIINSLTPVSGSLTKLGTGVLELKGVNVFTGGLNINAGAVKVTTSAAALGGTGNVVNLNNNAALWLNDVTLAGQTIVVGATGGTIATLADQSINDNITLNGALTISLADPTLNNTDRTINFNSATGGTAVISGTGSLVVSGNANNPFNATPKFLFMQSNQIANTYTGGTTINSGGRIKMGFASPTYLGAVDVAGSVGAFNGGLGSSSGSLTVNSGGVLDMNAFSQTVGNLTGTGGTITSTGTTLLAIGYGNTGGGNFAGVIATGATGSLLKVGTGTITLSGTNTFGNGSNGTTVASGTLALDFTTATTAAPVLLATAPLTLSGGTLDLRNGTAQVQAVASTTLAGGLSNVTRTTGSSILRMGAITPGAGIVNFSEDSIASTTNANNGAGILGGWATLGSTWAVNSGTLEGGGNNSITAYTGSFADVDRLGGTITSAANSNVRIIEAGGSTEVTPAAAGTTDIATLLQSATGGTATYNPDTADILRLGAAGGILVPSTAGALTIGTTAGDGHLTAGGAAATAGTIAITNNHATNLVTVNSIIENNGAVVGLATVGKVLLNAGNTYTGNTGIGSGTLEIGGAGQLGSGTYDGLIQIGSGGTLYVNTSANQTLNGVISGEGGLLKDGAGTLTLGTQQNTYKGNTIVNGGILDIGNRYTGDSGKLGGTLTINTNATAKVGDTLGYKSPATVLSVVNINGGTFDRYSGGNSTTGGLTINMTGGTLSHTGLGYWQMWAGNGFGQSSINTLASANSSLISGRVAFSSYDTQFNVADGGAPVDLEVSGHLITGGGAFGLIKNGAGLMALTNDNSVIENTYVGYTGTTTINSGTLQLGNNTTTGNLSPASAIVNNGTLAFNRANTLTQGTDINSVISGTGAVTQVGSGTTLLNGANTYSGATSVTGGTLVVSGSGSINSSSGITVNGSTAVFMQNSSVANSRSITLTQGTLGGTGTLTSAITSGSNVTIAPGDRTLVTPAKGTLTIQNALNLSGGTTDIRLFSTTDSDKLVQSTAGTITFGGTLNLSEASNFSGTYAIGNSWDLFEWTGTATGAFSSTSLPSLSSLPGSTWDTGSLYTTGVISIASSGGGAPTPQLAITTAANTRVLANASKTIAGTFGNSGTASLTATLTDNSGTLTVASFSPSSSQTVGAGTISQPFTGSISDVGTAGTGKTFSVVFDSATASGTLDVVNQRTFTAGTLSLGRVLTGSSLSSVVFTSAVSTSGAQATTTDATLNSFSVGTLSGISSPSFGGTGSFTGAGSTVSGSLSGTVTGTPGSISGSLSASIADELAGTSTVTGLVTVTGTAVADRAVSGIVVDLGDIGRRLAGSNLSLTGQTLSFSSTGSNSALTDVTIGGTTYDGTTTTGTLTGQSAGITGVAGSGTATISVAPVNAETNFSYTPATLTSTSYTATAVNQRTFALDTQPIALGRFLTGTTPAGTTSISSSGLNAVTANASVGSFGGTSAGSLTLTTSDATAFNGDTESQSASYTIGGTVTTPGALSGALFSSSVSAELGSIANMVVNITGTAVDQRSFNVGTPTLALGLVHAGAVPTGSTTAISSDGSHTVTADASLGGFDGSNTGSLTLETTDPTMFNGAVSQTATYTLGGSIAAGNLSSASFTAPVTEEMGTITDVLVNVTGSAFNGNGKWTSGSSGDWATNGNWTDSNSVHAAPGTFAGFADVDTATFDGTGAGTVISLNGASPSVKNVTFSGSVGYTINGTGGGTLALKADSGNATLSSSSTVAQLISAPVSLASNSDVSVTGGGTLSISGAISGSGSSLTKSGGGILELANASGNSYDGGTSVTGGSLLVNNTSGSGVGSGALSVGSSATLGGSGSIGAATTIDGIHAPGNSAVGIQTFSNGLAYAATSHLQWELNANSTSGSAFDSVGVSGGEFVISSGATLDLSFIGGVDFANSFWNASHSWKVADLGSSLTGDGGSSLFALAAYSGPNYTSAQGSFSVSRVADANAKNDVVLTWQSPYDVWATAKNLTGSNNALTAQADGDGLTNLIEYAFDTDPLNPASGPGAIAYNAGTSTLTHGQPTVSVVKTGSTVEASAIFGRRKDYAEAGLTYTVMFSADMSTWEDSVATPDVLHSDASLDMVKVPYPLFLTSGKKAAFFKVEVTKN